MIRNSVIPMLWMMTSLAHMTWRIWNSQATTAKIKPGKAATDASPWYGYGCCCWLQSLQETDEQRQNYETGNVQKNKNWTPSWRKTNGNEANCHQARRLYHTKWSSTETLMNMIIFVAAKTIWSEIDTLKRMGLIMIRHLPRWFHLKFWFF